MGGGVSTAVKDPALYVAELADDVAKAHLAKTKVWRVYSEDLEWAMQRIRGNQGELTIGRGHDNAIVLSNRTTSSKHAIMKFDATTKTWGVTDVGSSTGSIVFDGSKSTHLKKDVEQPLPLSCGIRCGKSILTLVSSQLTGDGMLECVRGPTKNMVWRVPTVSALFTAGASPKCDIDLSGIDGLAQVEFQIFKYNGWFAITDVSTRSIIRSAGKPEAADTAKKEEAAEADSKAPPPKGTFDDPIGDGKETEDGAVASARSEAAGEGLEEEFEDPAKEKYKVDDTKSKSDGQTSSNGIYLNGRQLKRREMHFLWMGCKIGVGIYNEEKKTVSFPAVFVFKCKPKALKLTA